MAESNIEWTDETDNIIVVEGGGWWCKKFNLLCKFCYAAALNMNTFFGGNRRPYAGKAPKLILRREIISSWARQRKPRKHFVASMTDVFGEWVERAWQFDFLDGMLAAPLQTFQVLTKRTAVMLKSVRLWMAARGIETPPQNIWLGFSAGNQETFDEAWASMKVLAEKGWTVFASLEPLLGPITLPDDFLAYGAQVQVITGGESGKNARPSHPDWFRALRFQCNSHGVPFFFKQWGEWLAVNIPRRKGGKLKLIRLDGRTEPATLVDAIFSNAEEEAVFVQRVGKKKAGRELDGRTWEEFPAAKAT